MGNQPHGTEYRALIEALDRLFAEVPPPETAEEVDEFLLDAGFDLDALAAHARVLAEELLEADWNARLQQARHEIDARRLAEQSSGKGTERDPKLNLDIAIGNLLRQLGLTALPQYRNHIALAEKDKELLLDDLERLATEQAEGTGDRGEG
jgi:hypothetical protein